MRTDTKFLDVSKNGWYSYYRRIPRQIRELPEFKDHKTFFKRSFKTKDRAVAELEVRKLNRWFDDLLGKTVKPKTTSETIRKVRDELRLRNLLPMKIDTSDIAQVRRYADAMDQYDDWINGADIDVSEEFMQEFKIKFEAEQLRQKLEQKYDDGKGGYKDADPYDEEVIKHRILSGEFQTEPEPTFEDAVEFYVAWYRENKATNDQQKEHWIKQIYSISGRLSKYFEGGMKAALNSLTRELVSEAAEEIWPNSHTRYTNMNGRMVPVISTWNQYKPTHKVEPNPFTNLVGQRALEQDTKTRRSATPEECKRYWDNVVALDNPEMKMIGLMLFYAGCPQGEAAGLLRGDLKLKQNVPHLIIRNNPYRRLGKKRLERVIPLTGEILDHWRDFIDNHFTGGRDDPLFPRYIKSTSSDKAKVLTPCIENLAGGDDKLTAYSLRHSFKDRYIAAGVPEGVGQYLFGHVTEASSQVHKDYGGLTRPEQFSDHMAKITNIGHFGYQEQYDD